MRFERILAGRQSQGHGRVTIHRKWGVGPSQEPARLASLAGPRKSCRAASVSSFIGRSGFFLLQDWFPIGYEGKAKAWEGGGIINYSF